MHCPHSHVQADTIEEWFGGVDDLTGRCARAQQAIKEFSSYIQPHIDHYRRVPSHTLISSLVVLVDSGELPERFLVPNIFFLVAAGYETTASLISASVLALMDNAEQMTLLRSDVDKYVGQAVQELMRYVLLFGAKRIF